MPIQLEPNFESTNPYRILGLPNYCSTEDIELACRTQLELCRDSDDMIEKVCN